jgi:hypothetical protein
MGATKGEAMSADINLAGLGLLSFLALFFPCTGLIERRRRKVREQRAYRQLLNEEAERIVAETSKQVEQGLWR